VDAAVTEAQRPVMRIVLAQACLSHPCPALWRIFWVRELAQLDLEEVQIQRAEKAAADAEELVRYPLSQFCVIGHPDPELSGIRAGAE